MLRSTRAMLFFLVASLWISSALLPGCSRLSGSSNLGKGTAYAVPTTHREDITGDDLEGEIQNKKEKQMVLLFRTLIQMEQTSDLSITSVQAETMLPLVRKMVSEGSVSSADHDQVVQLLTNQQHAFFADAVDRLDRFPNNQQQGAGPQNLTDEERSRLAEELEANQTITEWREESDSAGHSGATAGDTQNGSWLPNEKNIEQQLIELLEKKASAKSEPLTTGK